MKTRDTGKAGLVQEIFYSVQGEGLWAGRFQHFIRLKGCSVGCRFCDTPARFGERRDDAEAPVGPGHEKELTAEEVLEILVRHDRRMPGAHSFAMTGGEPLEQFDFLEDLLPRIKAAFPAQPILLETAGIHDVAMGRLAGKVDLVSMDFKIPSTSGLLGTLPLHEKFIEALKETDFYVKVIVDQYTPAREVEEVAGRVAKLRPDAPLFLQPVTREGRVWGGIYLLDLFRTARGLLRDVRVVPQIHTIMSLS